MPLHRTDGAEQRGIRWGPFTLRIPFYHTGIAWPEFVQGIFVAGATGLALVPLLTVEFGLSFEEAVALAFIHSVLISSAVIIFGEPFAPGWITPALPLVLSYILMTNSEGAAIYDSPSERFQVMTAISLDFAVLLFLLGFTGLGRKFVQWIPPALKGGIILGAAIAALKRVFLDDAERFLNRHPVSTTLAVFVCLVLAFSLPIQKFKLKYRWLAVVAGLGLLPGFLIAALVGPLPFVNEFSYEIEWGILIPPFASAIEKASPFSIGWPSAEMFLAGIPLALMGYVILFGDLVTGTEILKSAIPNRLDERITIEPNRTHISVAIRNLLMAFVAPFFPTQGCLWTGVHVIIIQRWKEGRKSMDSLYGGLSSYYVFGFPVLFCVLPLVTFLKPLMGIALSVTLVMTGFACAYVAMEIPRSQIERGVVLLMAVALAIFNPWIGMTIGIVAAFTLVGFRRAE